MLDRCRHIRQSRGALAPFLSLGLIKLLLEARCTPRRAWVGFPRQPHLHLRVPRVSALRAEASGDAGSRPAGGTLYVVQGAERFPIRWSADDTVDRIRDQVEEATGIPASKQELQLGNEEVLGTGNSLLSDYATTGAIRTLWLKDLRTPSERGEEEETVLDSMKTWWKLDAVTVLSVIAVVVEFVKDGLPLITGGLKPPQM
mmetsp:Transcript_58464/g.161783  ORF Transcript_58464/g.161783 Transcript_58464/m.161783 type:complete len:201 (+) Transcript_58464:46-648(+)